MGRIAIIDNSSVAVEGCEENAFIIKQYNGDEYDQELQKHLEYLQFLAAKKGDFRDMIKQIKDENY